MATNNAREKLLKKYGINGEKKEKNNTETFSDNSQGNAQKSRGPNKVREELIAKYGIYDTKVDDSFISSFLNDAKKYVNEGASANTRLGVGTSSNIYKSRKETAEELRSRSWEISKYLENNRDSVPEDYYTGLRSYLDSIGQYISQSMYSTYRADKFYSQFESAEDYDAWSKKESFISEYLADPEKATSTIDYEADWLKEAQYRAENNKVLGAEDFKDYSGYVSTKQDGILKPDYADTTYEIVNRNKDAWNQVTIGKQFGKYSDRQNADLRSYEYMTDDEVSVYNYHYAKGGWREGQAYLDSIKDILEARKNNQTVAETQKFGEDHPWAASGMSVLTSLGSGFEYLDDLIYYGQDKMAGKDATLDTNMSAAQTNIIRGSVSEQLDLQIGNWDAGAFLYSTAMSGVDSLASGLVFGKLGGAVLGLSAAAQGTNDALTRGMNDGQAFWNGLFAGVFEGLFETISIGNFNRLKEVAPESIKDIFKNLGKSMLVNASEETLTEIANIGYDTLINGDFANYTWEDLRNGAWKDAVLQVIEAGASGALMGVGMGSVSNAISYYKGSKAAEQTYGSDPGALVTEALEINPDNAFAQKMQGRLDSGKKLSGTQLMKLNNQVVEGDVQSIKAAAAQRLTELGETEDVDAIATALAKRFSGQELTRRESQLISNSQYGRRVSTEMNPENIQSGDYSSEWAEQIGTHRINVQEYSRLLESAQQPQDTAKTIGEQVAAETQNEAQAVQTEAVEAPTASDQQITGELTGKESLQVAEESSVAEDGITRQKSTNQAITPQKIVSISNGKVMIQTDGGTIAADDIQFGTKETDLLWRSAADFQGINTAGANGIIRAYQSGTPVTTYLNGAAQEFRNGYYNMESGGEYADKLTSSQRSIIYELGQKAAGENIAKEQAKKASVKKSSVTVSKTEKVGNVHFERNGRTFDQKRETALKTMEQLSKALGVDFYVYESYRNEAGQLVYKDANGNEVHAPNGFYDPSDGSIHIDLNAGADAKGTMLFTIAHELTHFIRQWAPAKFKVLANFLIKQYGENGVSVEKLVDTQIAKAAKNGRTIDYDTAFEEVVADSMEAIMTDGNVVQMMADLKQQDRTLWQKICDWFKELAADLKALVDTYKGVKPDSVEGRMVSQMQDVIVILESLYADALTDASENYQAAKAQNNTTQEGDVKYQARRLSSSDLDAYLKAGNRSNKNKIDAINSGKKIILTSAQEIVDFIRNSITKKAGSTTVAYGKVNDRLSDEVLLESNGKIEIKDNYLELIPDNLQHAYEQHNKAKEDGDIDLTQEDFEKIPEYLDSYTEVLYAIRYSSGNVRICVSKKLENGRILIIETVSKSRGSIQFKNAIGVSEEKYVNKYLDTYKKRAETNTRGNESSNNSLRDSFNSKESIRPDDGIVKEKFSDRDSDGNELSREQQEYFKDSKVRDEQGRLMVMYHGTPNGGFTKFRSGTYFTQNPGYADVYQNPGASSISTKRSADAPMTYKVYLDIKKPFDTRNAKERRIFQQEFYRKYGTGTPLADSGLPDWVDGMDLQEFIEKMEYDYDGLILDEGGTGGYGDEVKSRGLSYVVFDPSQVKNADNKKPTTDPDIRYSDRDNATYAEIEEERQKLYQRELELTKRKREVENNSELLRAMDDYSSLFSEMRGLLPKKRAGTASQTELDRIEEIKAQHEERLQQIADIQESLGLNALTKEAEEIRVQKEALRVASDEAWAREGAERENKAIEKAGLSAPEYFRKKALKAFKTTTNFNEAGYLLPDGKLLNFSGGERNHRYRDHREIGEIYEATQGVAALNRFLNDGNIRIMAESPGIDLAAGVEPTKEQYAAIKRFVTSHGTKERQFFVDFSDAEGRRAGNYSYDGYVNADRVVNDIKYYFENGAIREQSSVASFLNSDRDPELEKVNRVLEKENTELKHDVAYLKELLKLQNQATGGTKFTKTSVEAAARQLMKYADAKGDTKELAGLLNAVYEYIAGSKELTWDGVKEAAEPAVEWLQSHVRNRTERSAYAQDVLKQIRNSRIYLDEQQKKEVAYQYGSYNEFRKKTMGSVVLTDTAAMSLDSQWHEWAGQYPNLFDPDITSTDMPAALMEVFDSLRNMTETDAYGYDQELLGQELLSQVYDSYWNVSTLYTVKDKAQKEINKLKFDHAGRMATLKKYHKEQTAKLKAEHKEDLQRVRQEMRDRESAKLKKMQDQYHESRKKMSENRKKAEMRQKIRRTIMDLKKILNKGDKKRNVKEDMKDLVALALQSADILFTDNYGYEDMVRNGVGTELTEQEDKYITEAQSILDEIDGAGTAQERQEAENRLKGKLDYRIAKLKDVFVRERARLNKATVAEVLGSLADAYASLENSEQDYVKGAFDENVYQYLTMLKTEVGGTIVRDMSLYQMEELHKAYTMVLTTVRNANKMFAENLKQTREQLGSQVIGEVKQAGGEHGLWAPGEDKISTFSWNNEKPIYAFERIGSATLTKLFENTRAGEDRWAQDMTEAREYYLENVREYKYDSWDFAQQHKFTSTSGINFSLNLEQIMSLYAYSKREQAHDHLLKGGFVFDGNTEVQVNKMGIKMTYLNKTAKAHNISLELLAEIVSKLTPEQKAFVDQMQDYLSTTMGGKGNEVSMQMYGVKLFNEKYYFPLRSAGQYMERAKEADLKKQQGQISIVNSGFTKATTPKSSNPVVLSGFMDVWADHVNEMSMYHSFVLPMEDFRRVYNYASPNMETGQSVSVNSVIQDAYGEAATGYIDQLYRDLNGGAVSDPRENSIKSLVGRFKKAAVFTSLSVVIQQPSAIGRAFAIIDPKYFIGSKVDSKRHKALWTELKKYAPVAAIKEMGYFDTGLGKSAQDFIKGKEYNTLKEKAAALFTDGDYRDEVLSKAPALADELTWCAIWEAAKRETKAKNPKMDVRSEEFLQLAGKRFTECITKTQVYDSVLSRSANMRSKSVFMSMWTAFMAEPTTTINMVEDALRKGKRGDKKYAAKAMGAVLSSVILNSLLVSFVYAMRDDDEDETFLEKYVQSFTTEMLDGINPLTYYPFLKDVWSALQGFDIERSDMSLITSLTEKITKLVQVYAKDVESRKEGELADAWWGVVDYATALAGIPVKNVRRDINGAINTYKTISKDLTERDTSLGSLLDKTWDDVKNTIPVIGWLPDETAADKLYKATINGDTAYQKRLTSSYQTENSLNNAIRKGLRSNDSRIWEAAISWNNNDLETYKTIAKEIVAEGNFSQDNIVAAIRAEAAALTPDDGETSTTSKAKGYFTIDKFSVAISQGNATMADVIKTDIVETAQKNGKTAQEAENSFVSSAKSSLKEMFIEGGVTATQAIDALTEYCGVEEEDAQEDILYWDFLTKYPDYSDLSESAVKKYYEYAASAGISADVYYDARKFTSTIDGDGSYGSVKNQYVQYILSLDLTSEQQNAMWHALKNSSWTEKDTPFY